MAESLEDILYNIQKTKKAPLIAHLLPNENQIHEVDLSTRTINVPQFLSVRYDHNAEVIYFKTPRYFEGVDLADTICVIQYINARGQAGIYYVPYYDVDHYDSDFDDTIINEEEYDQQLLLSTPVMLIPWSIGGLATIASGRLQFSIRFYKIDDDTKKFLFNISTKPASGQILHGLDLPADIIEEFELDNSATLTLYQQMFQLAGGAATYWIDV